MKQIVGEGRTIISNIERVSALYLTKTIYSILLCIIYIILRKSYPFIPIQLSLIGGTAIGIPSFVLALEHHEETIPKGFLRNVLRVSGGNLYGGKSGCDYIGGRMVFVIRIDFIDDASDRGRNCKFRSACGSLYPDEQSTICTLPYGDRHICRRNPVTPGIFRHGTDHASDYDSFIDPNPRWTSSRARVI